MSNAEKGVIYMSDNKRPNMKVCPVCGHPLYLHIPEGFRVRPGLHPYPYVDGYRDNEPKEVTNETTL